MLTAPAPEAPAASQSAASGSGPALLDHEYDGIREYDNPTPGWWHAIFFLTILMCVPYCARYHLDEDAPTVQGDWAADQSAAYAKLFAGIGELKTDEPTILQMMGDPKWMTVAESMFKGNCATCHGDKGQGSVGVNLTDEQYKNIKTLTDFPKVITAGANGGAMPAWKGRLSQNEIVLLSAYAANLRGKNVPGGRAAEGEVPPPWPKPIAPAPSTTPDAPKPAK